jgi:NTP pyrophosphatase (non-canonical NTP hydrolase)
MDINEYQIEADRTAMPSEEQAKRISIAILTNPNLSQVLVGALKLNSESGELADAIVKHISYNQPLDVENILEECGDLCWYIALITRYLGSTIETVMLNNIDKLKIRYPEKYTDEHAKERLDKK